MLINSHDHVVLNPERNRFDGIPGFLLHLYKSFLKGQKNGSQQLQFKFLFL